MPRRLSCADAVRLLGGTGPFGKAVDNLLGGATAGKTHLGERVFTVVKAGTDLPTDLAGVSPAVLDAADATDLVSALGPVTTMVEIWMGLSDDRGRLVGPRDDLA
ncbi:hypothetical protein [Actinoplanes solisilvae]|uniref:NACHT N-terminal helical domain 7-containing protein n=1 Tax=Actinoplanes solisilvae TaxID=2486853 RepID=UPI000FD9C89F|nr:hypothetical protein [Actinoplanes solisilvae]